MKRRVRWPNLPLLKQTSSPLRLGPLRSTQGHLSILIQVKRTRSQPLPNRLLQRLMILWPILLLLKKHRPKLFPSLPRLHTPHCMVQNHHYPFNNFFNHQDLGAFDLGSFEPEAATPSNLQWARDLVIGLASKDLNALPSVADVDAALGSFLTDPSLSSGQISLLKELQERLPGCRTLVQMASLSLREAESHLAGRKKAVDFPESAKTRYEVGKETRVTSSFRRHLASDLHCQTQIATSKARSRGGHQ